MAKRRGNQKLKVFESKEQLDWDYDGEADVLYLSFGEPREAIGLDIGSGVTVRYDEEEDEIVGLTIMGIKDKLSEFLVEKSHE